MGTIPQVNDILELATIFNDSRIIYFILKFIFENYFEEMNPQVRDQLISILQSCNYRYEEICDYCLQCYSLQTNIPNDSSGKKDFYHTMGTLMKLGEYFSKQCNYSRNNEVFLILY